MLLQKLLIFYTCKKVGNFGNPRGLRSVSADWKKVDFSGRGCGQRPNIYFFISWWREKDDDEGVRGERRREEERRGKNWWSLSLSVKNDMGVNVMLQPGATLFSLANNLGIVRFLGSSEIKVKYKKTKNKLAIVNTIHWYLFCPRQTSIVCMYLRQWNLVRINHFANCFLQECIY